MNKFNKFLNYFAICISISSLGMLIFQILSTKPKALFGFIGFITILWALHRTINIVYNSYIKKG